jgi:hypothetical protein
LTGLASDPCTPSGPPPPPAVTGGGGPDLVLALQNLRFAVDYGGDGAPPSVRGLDLDHACSRENGTPTTCVTAVVGSPHKDDSNGVDNALGWLLIDNQTQLTTFLSPNSDPRVTLLLRLRGYNGQPDDDNVEVDAFVSGGVEPLDDAGTPTEPQWKGMDQWTVSCETIPNCEAGTLSLLTQASDTSAYVTGGVLVSRNIGFLPLAASLQLQGGGFVSVPLKLYDPLIVAPLVPEEGGVGIHGGLFGARWPTAEMIAAIASLCIGPTTSKRFVCPGADLAQMAKLDGTGHACDAFSIGMTFDAHRATLTNRVVPIVYNGPCDASATGDCP